MPDPIRNGGIPPRLLKNAVFGNYTSIRAALELKCVKGVPIRNGSVQDFTGWSGRHPDLSMHTSVDVESRAKPAQCAGIWRWQ
jgi:hypothetical protein